MLLNKIVKSGFWLAGSPATNQLETMLENPH